MHAVHGSYITRSYDRTPYSSLAYCPSMLSLLCIPIHSFLCLPRYLWLPVRYTYIIFYAYVLTYTYLPSKCVSRPLSLPTCYLHSILRLST